MGISFSGHVIKTLTERFAFQGKHVQEEMAVKAFGTKLEMAITRPGPRVGPGQKGTGRLMRCGDVARGEGYVVMVKGKPTQRYKPLRVRVEGYMRRAAQHARTATQLPVHRSKHTPHYGKRECRA